MGTAKQSSEIRAQTNATATEAFELFASAETVSPIIDWKLSAGAQSGKNRKALSHVS
jgi:hypothetical protein